MAVKGNCRSAVNTALTTSTERPVFVAATNRRARGLRYAAVLALVLAGTWLAALAIGMLGFGRLPGVSLPLAGQNEQKASEPAAVTRRSSDSSAEIRATRAISRRVESTSRTTAVSATPHQRARRGATTEPITSHAPAAEPASRAQATQPATAAAPSPTAPHTGWARRGTTAPPGQTTRLEAQPTGTKAQPPGQARRAADTTTVPATPVTTPEPPGQQKKTDEPTP